jgi:porphobilinogen deaminase
MEVHIVPVRTVGALLAALEAGCSAPVSALAEVVEDLGDDGRVVLRLSLRGVVATADGDLLRASATGKLTDAENLGRHVAAELLDPGASTASGTMSPNWSARRELDGSDVYTAWSGRWYRVHGANRQQR